MLLLFETPGGYALFKILKSGKLTDATNVAEQFRVAENVSSLIKSILVIYVSLKR